MARMELARPHWEDTIQQKRSQRESLVKPFLCPTNGDCVSSERILEIGDIELLSRSLSSGKLTAQDLVRSYVKR